MFLYISRNINWNGANINPSLAKKFDPAYPVICIMYDTYHGQWTIMVTVAELPLVLKILGTGGTKNIIIKTTNS